MKSLLRPTTTGKITTAPGDARMKWRVAAKPTQSAVVRPGLKRPLPVRSLGFQNNMLYPSSEGRDGTSTTTYSLSR